MIYHFLKCFHSELVELVWYISIDTSIAQLTLFRIIRCFLVMSSVLEVWPKGVRWQAWGAGRRRWRCVLTYRTANCNFHSNFNCECNVYMMLVVQTMPAVQKFSASLYWILETNTGRVDHQDHSGDRWQWKSAWESLLKCTIRCKPHLLLAKPHHSDYHWHGWHSRYGLTLFCFWIDVHVLHASPSGPILVTVDNQYGIIATVDN